MTPEPELPPYPTIPPWPRLKVFIFGAMWAILCALPPTIIILRDWATRWDDPVDWGMIAHMTSANIVIALIAYWRKYRALIQAPPGSPMATVIATVLVPQQVAPPEEKQ